MRCPKCSYVSFEYLSTCKKCGKDLFKHKEIYNILAFQDGYLDIIGYLNKNSSDIKTSSDIKQQETAMQMQEDSNVAVATEEPAEEGYTDTDTEALLSDEIPVTTESEGQAVLNIEDNIGLEENKGTEKLSGAEELTLEGDELTLDLDERTGDLDIGIADLDTQTIEEDKKAVEKTEEGGIDAGAGGIDFGLMGDSTETNDITVPQERADIAEAETSDILGILDDSSIATDTDKANVLDEIMDTKPQPEVEAEDVSHVSIKPPEQDNETGIDINLPESEVLDLNLEEEISAAIEEASIEADIDFDLPSELGLESVEGTDTASSSTTSSSMDTDIDTNTTKAQASETPSEKKEGNIFDIDLGGDDLLNLGNIDLQIDDSPDDHNDDKKDK